MSIVRVPETALPKGSIFQGGYEILDEVGAGAFGRVYEARHLSTGQRAAIKVLRPFPGREPDTQRITERFRRETRLCFALTHPNIVRLIDAGDSEDGLLYAVFQFVPGVTLKEVLLREGRLALPEAVHLMSQVLDALSCAHAEGIVHRDLKPENIMIMKTGVRRNAMVLDFGLGGFTRDAETRDASRITATRELMGTPSYAAPEQLRGEPPSTRADLYSWGLIFLECLTGELAVGGASTQEVIYKQLGPDPVPMPDWLRGHRLGRVLATVTSKAIEKRDVTIEGLLEALSVVEPSVTPRVAPAPSRDLPSERRQLTVVACRVTVCGSPRETLDPDEADERLHLHHEAYAQIVGRAGGCAAGVMADRILFVFGYPQAREDDARRATGAALQIVAEAARASGPEGASDVRVAVRLGVHTGLVLVRELRYGRGQGLDQLAGLTAQIAMGLAELAPVGTVLASDDTRRLLGDEVVAEATGMLAMPELSRGLPAFRLREPERPARGRGSLTGRHETILVGRSRQLADLVKCWEDAEAGRPGGVLLRGEPGIGKSRLARELRRIVPSDAWLQTRCVAENQDSPLRPVVDLLGTLEEPIDAFLVRHGFNLDETLPLFAALLSWPADRYVPLPLSPERRKELTLNALLVLFLRLAEERSLVLAFEDLHWADVTTLEFLGLLVQELRVGAAIGGPAPRLCAVFTARPEFQPAWPNEDYRLIQLARLDEREVAEMITVGLESGAALAPAVIADVVQRADGIPLFVEEVTRVLIESEALPAASPAGGRPFQIPATLRDLLTARLDTLSAGAKETAQLAAVLGREFRYELLRAVSTKKESELRDDLAGLQTMGLVFHRRSVRGESYVFKHALVRDAAYESLTRTVRQRLHQRVANTMRHRFPELERNRPEILATHFERGGQLAAAIEYLHRAGSNALHRAAYQEAFILLDRALSLLRSLKPSPAVRRQEVELLSTLGNVQISTSGYAAPDVEETFRRAWAQCEELGGDIPTHVLFGIWGVNVTRSDRAGVGAILPRLQRIVAESDDPVALTAAYAALGAAAYWDGEHRAAHHFFARGRECFHAEEFGRFAQTYGYGAGLYSFAFGMTALWLLGYPEQALAVREELYAIASRSRDPYVTIVAEGLAMTVAHERDEPEVELEIADRVMTLADEQRSLLWRAAALIGRGGALLRRGHSEEAAARIHEGLELFKRIGIMCSYTYFLPYLADAHLRAGKLAEGLGVIDEGLGLSRTLVARLQEPELLRLRGEILLLGGQRDEAGPCFERAIEVVQSGQGRSYELRATMSLVRLWREQGRREEARILLQKRYDWFTEGFDTPDLRAARSLLAELA